MNRRVPSYAAFAIAVTMTRGVFAADPPPPTGTPSAPPSAAAPAEPASEKAPDIGQRDAWLFGVDNLFGVMQQKLKIDEASVNLENLGFVPSLTGTRASLHHVWQGGLTLGTQLSAYYQAPRGDRDASGFVYFGPRVGYAGSIPKAPFGYWVRGGPSLFNVFADDSAWSLALAGEANIVFRVGPTIAVLFGFGFDVPIAGKINQTRAARPGQPASEQSIDFGYSSLSFGFGVMAEL